MIRDLFAAVGAVTLTLIALHLLDFTEPLEWAADLVMGL